jgi:hypothetical protein
MKSRNKAVFGIYGTPAQAEVAVQELLGAGFSSEDVSLLMPDQPSSRPLVAEKESKAPEGAVTGGVIGGALGVIVGLVSLAIPGVGPFLAAGPIVAALAGLGAGGAVGGLIGALVGLGIPEYEAKRYEGFVRHGGSLLSVHCETAGEVLRAKEVLKGTGATDIAATGEATAKRERAASRPAARKETRAQETRGTIRANEEPAPPTAADRDPYTGDRAPR